MQPTLTLWHLDFDEVPWLILPIVFQPVHREVDIWVLLWWNTSRAHLCPLMHYWNKNPPAGIWTRSWWGYSFRAPNNTCVICCHFTSISESCREPLGWTLVCQSANRAVLPEQLRHRHATWLSSNQKVSASAAAAVLTNTRTRWLGRSTRDDQWGRRGKHWLVAVV